MEAVEKAKTRARAGSVCESEIITLVICYHLSGYRTFKWFYLRFAQKYLLPDFPGLPSYNRFIELMPDVLIPIAAFMQSRCGKGKGIAFIDSTSLCVCKNIRIPRHKTFKDVAGRGNSSTGWFYGFKLHLMVDDCGKILSQAAMLMIGSPSLKWPKTLLANCSAIKVTFQKSSLNFWPWMTLN